MRVRKPSGTPWIPGRRPGFTLLEMVLVMWALQIIFLLGTVTLLGALKVQQSAAAVFQRLAGRSALADDFRADVSQAASAPQSLDQLTASPTCLILRLADSRHVVYLWKDKQLERSELASSGTSRRQVPVGPDCIAVEFLRAGSDARLITIRLIESPGHGNVIGLADISAALGGDLR